MEQKRWWRREGIHLVLLLTAVTAFYWEGIRPGNTFLPVDLAANNLPWRGEQPLPLQNWLISDPLYQFYPFLVQAVRSAREFQWPLWNPYIMLGHPSLADPLAQPFYPLTLASGLLFGPARGLAVALWLQALLAAGLAYGWLRHAGCRPVAAVGGSLVYVLGGYMVTWFETTFWLSTLSLLPGILWAFDAAVRHRRRKYAAIAGILFGLAILAGQLQIMGAFALFLGLYALGHALVARRAGEESVAWPILALFGVLITGGLLSAVAILPFAQLLATSRRVTVQGLQDTLPPLKLITLFVPNFFGNPATDRGYWGASNFSESTIYAGLVALLLASLAPFAKRKLFVAYIALLALLVPYVIVGGPGVALFGSLPGLKYISLHRSAFILPLLIAYLAAATLDVPRVPWRPALLSCALFASVMLLAVLLDLGGSRAHWDFLRGEISRGLMLLALVLIILWARHRMSAWERRFAWLLVSLLFADLFVFGRSYNPAGAVSELMPPTPSLDHLQGNVGNGRLVTLQRDDQVLFGPNVPSVFRIPEAGGYSSLVNARYHQLVLKGDPELDVWWMDRGGNMVTFSNPSLPLMDLFQVSHVASPEPLPDLVAPRAEITNDSCQAATRSVGQDRPLQGRFTARNTAINRLDLRLARPADTAPEGHLVFRLREGERLILEERVDAVPLEDGQLLTLFFAPERDAPGRHYEWEITADSPDSGIALCRDSDGIPAVSVYGSDWAAAYEGEIMVYERLVPLPRAYVVYAARHAPDDETAADQLLDPAFPLRRVALTAQPVDLPAETERYLTPATLVSYEDTRVVVQANAAAPGLLILGDQYYPGWEARLDGERVPIVRSNHIFRGVLLPPGPHEVVFTFRPQSLVQGLAISLVGLTLVIGMALTDRKSN